MKQHLECHRKYSLHRPLIPVLLLFLTPLLKASDYPLQWVKMSPAEADAAPGVAGSFCQSQKPAALEHETKPFSAQPLYGQLGPGAVFRLDEAKGTGRGYNLLTVDLNLNADLRDDPIFRKLPGSDLKFGPFPPPGNTPAAAHRGGWYAKLTVYDGSYPGSTGRKPRQKTGYLRLKSAEYLETKVEFDGRSEKVGFLDGNCNFHWGDPVHYDHPSTVNPEYWDLQSADYILRDRDGSGKFERQPFAGEIEPFASVIYFDGRPFRFAINPESSRLSLEAGESFCGMLELSGGRMIRNLTFLRQTAEGPWECLRPEMARQEIWLLPGRYRLLSCCLAAQHSKSEMIVAIGGYQPPTKEFTVEAGQRIALACGGPLSLIIHTETVLVRDWEAYRKLTPSQSSCSIRITGQVVGAGGETYRRFYRVGQSRVMIPLKDARFRAFDDRHALIDQGKMTVESEGILQGHWIVPKNVLRYNQSVYLTVEYDLGKDLAPTKPLRSQEVAVSFAE